MHEYSFHDAEVLKPAGENTIREPEKKGNGLMVWLIAAVTIALVLLSVLIYILVTGAIGRNVSTFKYSNIPGGAITFSSPAPSDKITDSTLMSVVNIKTNNSFDGFFGTSINRGASTGVIIREDGYILTSLYLVENEGNITVTLHDSKEYEASVYDVDITNGVAILKIEASGLSKVKIGDSSKASVGDGVTVIGNALNSNLSNPITGGYICGINNNVPLDNGNSINILQIDAATISNSVGGLVFNAEGELIGIATAMISNSSSEIGLVTPINDLKQTMGELVEMNGPSPTSGLVIGITGSDASYGVSVTRIGEGTPAEKSDIRVGDLIVKVDGEAVSTISEINEIKARHVKGDTIILTIYREGEMMDVSVILE